MKLNKVTVLKELRIMIEKRYLENYELDYYENRIYNVDKEKRRKEEQLNPRVVQFSNCHAYNKLQEKIGRCEFCNSYIE